MSNALTERSVTPRSVWSYRKDRDCKASALLYKHYLHHPLDRLDLALRMPPIALLPTHGASAAMPGAV